MDERAQQIIETATELAVQDGYAAVRLRDIAARAGVALGTVYKRFASKEDILMAVMVNEGQRLFTQMTETTHGDTPAERATNFFSRATDGFLARPKLARAILRALSSGSDLSVPMHTLELHTISLLVRAIDDTSRSPKDNETIATILQQVWSACLIGWVSGLYEGRDDVMQQMENAIQKLLF